MLSRRLNLISKPTVRLIRRVNDHRDRIYNIIEELERDRDDFGVERRNDEMKKVDDKEDVVNEDDYGKSN